MKLNSNISSTYSWTVISRCNQPNSINEILLLFFYSNTLLRLKCISVGTSQGSAATCPWRQHSPWAVRGEQRVCQHQVSASQLFIYGILTGCQHHSHQHHSPPQQTSCRSDTSSLRCLWAPWTHVFSEKPRHKQWCDTSSPKPYSWREPLLWFKASRAEMWTLAG